MHMSCAVVGRLVWAWGLVVGLAAAAVAEAPASTVRRLPALAWQERSDWLNVRTAASPRAAGDGVADDTVALQNALDRLAAARREGGPSGGISTLFLPAGTYRITRTLSLVGPVVGAAVIGCGRDTRLVWDGEPGGRMLHINGLCYSFFEGLELDGRGKAAVGFYYNSEKRFQTEVTHRHLAFRNFTDAGMLNDPARAQALAETTFENCLFVRCRRGAAFPQFNDYDYTFDGCEFVQCHVGVECVHGNFYIRNCHFEQSRVADIEDHSEHGSSVRRTTSHGSRLFVSRTSSVAPITLQDCRVDGWTHPGGAVLLSRPPSMIFDCTFTNPPRDAQGRALPPVRAHSDGQRILTTGNVVRGAAGLFQPTQKPSVYAIPAGAPGGVTRSASQSFFRDAARIPGKVFDARRDFGAKGDGKADDTTAIQRTIEAAAASHGRAIAYLPAGDYAVTRTLLVSGRDFTVGGSGWATRLIWKGPAGGTMVEVRNPQRLTLENMTVGSHDAGAMANAVDIRQVGAGRATHMTYDNVTAFGMYHREPFRKGFWFMGLGPGEVVVMPHVQGNLHFVDCARATILANCSYEGSVVVEGKGRVRNGLLGFQTRLATLVDYGLYLRDSQNIVMSDFYVEQSDNGYRLEGSPGDPPGRATLQGAKVQFTVPEGDPHVCTTFDVRGYRGSLFFGPDQFYIEPKSKRIRQQGAGPFDLYLLGCVWYDNKPQVEIGPEARLHIIANEAMGMDKVQYTADDQLPPTNLLPLAAAVADLRRLGAADARLNHPAGRREAAGRRTGYKEQEAATVR